jgi:pimeloyl-ACP methyl ester carboxylesterase
MMIPEQKVRHYGILDSPDISINVALSNGAGNPILNEDSQNNPQTSRLHEITIPSLFVWGKYDFVVPPAIGYAAYSLVNTSEKQIYLMDHSGHSPMSNEAVIFTEKLIAFIEMYK